MITSVNQVLGERLIVDALHFLNSEVEGGKWATIVEDEPPLFHIEFHTRRMPEILQRACSMAESLGLKTGANDWAGMIAMSAWLREGPKVVRPTLEQAQSFAHVDVSMELMEYEQPYPAILVEIPKEFWRGHANLDPKAGPVDEHFKAVLLHRHAPNILIAVLHSFTGNNDIVTMARQATGEPLESFITRMAPNLEPVRPLSRLALHVALNMCLALTNWGYKTEPLSPAQRRDDERMSGEDSERGRRARRRLRESLDRVGFVREIIVRRSPSCKEKGAVATGKTVAPHWVRGHWKMQPCGPRHSLRKRTFVAPYLVHPDLYESSERITAYRDHREGCQIGVVQ